MEFRVLGPLQVWCGDGEVAVPAGRHRALLATLLLRRNQVVPTGELITRIWGEQQPADARAAAQTYVHRLRRVLGQGLIHTRPDGYLISVGADQLDLARFDDLFERSRRAGDPAQEAALLTEALALWRGPALSNVASESLHREEVPVLVEHRLRALERRIELDLAAGRHGDLVAELRSLTVEHPLREQFWAQLMTALAGCGRPAEAVQAYQDLRRLLAEELGTDPGASLQQLHQAILGGEAAAERAGHRQPRPAQLPADVPGFTGRADQLRRLDAVLADGSAAVLADGSVAVLADESVAVLADGSAAAPTAVAISVIEGAAGIGKTALALHWAHRVRHRFPDGQLYVNLRGHAVDPPLRPVDALAVFLPALGVPAEQVPTDADRAGAVYRSLLADRRMLVVLDNASDPEQVRPLLPGGGGCAVLVTSRHHMGGLVARDGAHRLVLGVLNPDEAHSLLTRVLGGDRFTAEPSAARHLAQLCGYLPLALRIAAANLTEVAGQRIAAYNAHLARDRITALAAPGDDGTAVHAAFDLSYTWLPAPAQRLFRLLGLVPVPDLTVESAAALAGTTAAQVRPLLQQLARAHLVEQHAPGRYALHDLLRLYAASRAYHDDPEPGRNAAVQRFYEDYRRRADAATRLLHPHSLRLPSPPGAATATRVSLSGPAEALVWLDTERANLVAIVSHTAEHGPHRVAWLLADALRPYFHTRVHAVDWLAVARAGRKAAVRGGELSAQAAAELSLADLRWRQGRHAVGIDHAVQALSLARRAGWADGLAAILSGLGAVCWQAGRLEEATGYLVEALARGLPTGRLPSAHPAAVGGPAPADVALGQIHHAWGHLDTALDHFNRSLAIDRATEADRSRGMTLCILARVCRDAGLPEQSLDVANQALALARGSGRRRLEADARNALAGAHLSLGHQTEAIHHYENALRIAEETADPHPHAEALIGLATAHHRVGRHDRARHLVQQALTIAHRAGFHLLHAQALSTLAAIDLHDHDACRTIANAKRALVIYRETGHRLGEAQTRLILDRAQQLAVATHCT